MYSLFPWPKVLLSASVGIMYAAVCPPILPFVIFHLGVCYLVYARGLLYSHTRGWMSGKADGGQGLMWHVASKWLLVALGGDGYTSNGYTCNGYTCNGSTCNGYIHHPCLRLPYTMAILYLLWQSYTHYGHPIPTMAILYFLWPSYTYYGHHMAILYIGWP